MSRFGLYCVIFDFCLSGQIVCGCYWCYQVFYGEEGGEVSGVGRNYDQDKELLYCFDNMF